MSDAIDAHEFGSVVDFIENAVLADANPPVVDSASQFSTAARSRVLREGSQSGNDSRSNVLGEPIQVFLGVSLEKDSMHAAWSCAPPDNLPGGDIGVFRHAGV